MISKAVRHLETRVAGDPPNEPRVNETPAQYLYRHSQKYGVLPWYLPGLGYMNPPNLGVLRERASEDPRGFLNALAATERVPPTQHYRGSPIGEFGSTLWHEAGEEIHRWAWGDKQPSNLSAAMLHFRRAAAAITGEDADEAMDEVYPLAVQTNLENGRAALAEATRRTRFLESLSPFSGLKDIWPDWLPDPSLPNLLWMGVAAVGGVWLLGQYLKGR